MIKESILMVFCVFMFGCAGTDRRNYDLNTVIEDILVSLDCIALSGGDGRIHLYDYGNVDLYAKELSWYFSDSNLMAAVMESGRVPVSDSVDMVLVYAMSVNPYHAYTILVSIRDRSFEFNGTAELFFKDKLSLLVPGHEDAVYSMIQDTGLSYDQFASDLHRFLNEKSVRME